jgi:hypothetical protein
MMPTTEPKPGIEYDVKLLGGQLVYVPVKK